MLLVTWFYSRVLLQVPCVLVPVLLICMCSCVCSRVRALLAICCSRSRHLQTCCSPCTAHPSPPHSNNEICHLCHQHQGSLTGVKTTPGQGKKIALRGEIRSQSFLSNKLHPKIYTFFGCLRFSFMKIWNYSWLWSSFYHIHFIHFQIDYDNHDFSEMSKVSVLKRILHKKIFVCVKTLANIRSKEN